ncbi:snurportin-1 [Lutzomyia longipalpis]|uniref:snurportin-1 n=1 Tax=Lutzomyia longipalpis TaxID=7200 RepID=UPI00248342BA|nr:snurportin-1 [Lutzomyia longipalpis]
MDDFFVHKYRELYKNRTPGREGCQRERRRKLLEEQKHQRQQTTDENRGITKFVQKQPRDAKQAAVFDRFYANKIQLSEWLKEKPEDLDNWYIVPCPKGKRCLVVASDKTRSYTKAGKLLHSFHSSLEGGRSGRYVTVLDCIFYRSEYFVLDCLVYRNQEFINCETSFRFFWLTSKFLEYDYTVIHRDNHLPFHLIPRYDCADEACLASALETHPHWPENTPVLDGFLFYHKEASYTYGTTPLVGWLFSFMIPEILGVEAIHPEYKKTPPNYTNASAFMKAFDKKQKKKRYSTRRKKNTMDVDEGSSTSAIMEQQKQLELGELDMDCEHAEDQEEDEEEIEENSHNA